MNIFNSGIGTASAHALAMFGPWLAVLIIWSLFWKGLALWHAGRRGHAWWFVILLIVNTVGVLEIVYLFWVLKLKFSDLFKK
jgi:methionyl-tRNA synthetase